MTPDIIDLHGSNQVSGWNRVPSTVSIGRASGTSSAIAASTSARTRSKALSTADPNRSGDIELGRIEAMAVVRKAGRLARLLDDADAMLWLRYEATGYPRGPNGLPS